MILRLTLLVLLVAASINLSGQTQEELRSMKLEKSGQVEDHQALIKALEDEIKIIQSQINEIAGWRKGFSGIVGFDWDRSWTWISNPNPDSRSSSLNLGLVGYLKNDQDKYFWHNSASLQKAWKRFDTNTRDTIGDEGLFKNGTLDILNVSSLYGYKLKPNLAVSALLEVYSSLEKLTNQGTADFGIGVSWLPLNNLTVTINPINYHYSYSDLFGINSEGALGAKLRIDYLLNFKLLANNCTWQSSLTGFIPYGSTGEDVFNDLSNPELLVYNSSLSEITWLNTWTLQLWKGVGLGFGWGIRRSQFEAFPGEAPKTQGYMNFGVSYEY